MTVIIVSGINGCGKTTFCDRLKSTFEELGITATYIKTPNYQTESGRLLERWMKGLEPDITYEQAEALFAQNRDAVAEMIRSMQSENKVLIVDRLTLDADVYAQIRKTKRLGANNDDIADVQIFLDTQPETALARLQTRGAGPHRYHVAETLSKARQIFHEKISQKKYAPTLVRVSGNALLSKKKLISLCHLLLHRSGSCLLCSDSDA